jgi:hypothetical protein
MRVFAAKNRTAITGIAATFLAAGLIAGVTAVANPGLVNAFSAHADEVVTGQTPAVTLVLNETQHGSAGVVLGDN